VNLFGDRIVEYVFGLDVSMAEVPVVEILDGGDELESDELDFCFGLRLAVSEGGVGEVIHNEEGRALLDVEVEGPVLADSRVVHFLHEDKVSLQLLDMFLLDLELFGCVETLVALVEALVDYCVGALSYLLQQLILL